MNDVTIDCRWLGYSGVGRVLSSLLSGLQALVPPGRWALWGPAAVEAHVWAGASWHRNDEPPLRRWGQQSAFDLPRAHVVVFPHLVRPLAVRGRAVVIAHDTIPVRHAPTALRRVGMRAIYAASVHTAWRVMAYSDATERRLRADLRLRPASVRRIELPWSTQLVEAVRRQRVEPAVDQLLYIGLDRPQKNLDRALIAFASSSFASAGGRFRLVGLKDGGDVRLRALASDLGVQDQVTCEGIVSEEALVDALARATALILPSTEEGFGLPVVEALASGVPVACSATGGPEEAARGHATLFDPWRVEAIASAIDEVVTSARERTPAEVADAFAAEVPVVTPEAFAADVLRVLAGD